VRKLGIASELLRSKWKGLVASEVLFATGRWVLHWTACKGAAIFVFSSRGTACASTSAGKAQWVKHASPRGPGTGESVMLGKARAARYV
jgi:hypothetical protein